MLPAGWRDRLVRYESPATNGVVAWCLDVHDLWLSKAVALRPKNIEFCAALATRRYVDADTLQTRLGEIADLSDDRRTRVRRLIEVARSAS